GVRVDPGRIEPHRRGPDDADAGQRTDRADRPARGSPRPHRLRQPGAVARGSLPLRVRARGDGAGTMTRAGVATAEATARGSLMTPSPRARAVGLGTVFGKTFRDSRRTAFMIGAILVLIVLATGAQIVVSFDTAGKRAELALEM